MHGEKTDIFSADLSAFDLSAPSPRILLEVTCSEFLPPWDAVREIALKLQRV